MNLVRKNVSSGRSLIKAPTHDPYGRYRNTGNGLFGFRQDKHVIIPGVTSYEEARLQRVKNYVEKQTGKPCTLSQELINDIYSIYVNEDVKRRPENDKNAVRHEILDRVYDSLTKVVTVDSPLYTQMLTREMALALQKIDDQMRDQQNKQDPGSGDGEDGGLEGSEMDGEGDGNGESSGEEGKEGSNEAGKGSGSGNSKLDEVKKALEKNQDKIEKAKKDADQKIKELEQQIGKEAMKDLSNNSPDFLDEIEKLKQTLKNVSFNKNSIKKVLEKILNESMNYFSTKFKRVEESLFDCEECEDLFGLEFLHPIFKNAEIMSVGNETRIYKGKMDLYLDCSGSMGSSANFEGTSISMKNLVKGIAIMLYRMGMVENLYFFDTNIYKIENINEISILSFYRSGGTDFNKVVKEIRANGNNSVVITDGYDSCHDYTKQAFWIGVGGTTFQSYGNDAFQTYRSTGQCVAYNSKTSNFDYCK